MVDLGETGPVPEHLMSVLEQRCTEQCSEQHTYTLGCELAVGKAAPSAADHFREGLRGWFEWRGLDPSGEALDGTPDRWLRAMDEFTVGYDLDPEKILGRTFTMEHSGEPIAVSGVPFISICEHHLLPFTGSALIAYVPRSGTRVVGLSKLPRLLDVYAKRLQTQERITVQVTHALDQYLKPRGSACVIRSEHGCLAHRGARKPGAVMTTSSFTGYLSDPARRRELLETVGEW